MVICIWNILTFCSDHPYERLIKYIFKRELYLSACWTKLNPNYSREARVDIGVFISYRGKRVELCGSANIRINRLGTYRAEFPSSCPVYCGQNAMLAYIMEGESWFSRMNCDPNSLSRSVFFYLNKRKKYKKWTFQCPEVGTLITVCVFLEHHGG
jgi:hypothetical protein